MDHKVEIKEVQEIKPLEEITTTKAEIVEVESDDVEIEDILPQMNVHIPQMEQKPELITDENLMGIYDEILDRIRKEYDQTTDYIDNFAEMVINQGDSHSSTKEALVNLVKIRSDLPDKMVKVADLMTRLKMKDPNTYKPYLNAHQTNNVVITDTSAERRSLLTSIKKAKQAKKK
jgi:hypothetical protein